MPGELMKPVVCPRCHGSGAVQIEEETLVGPVARLEPSISQIDRNWDLRQSQEFTRVQEVPTFQAPRTIALTEPLFLVKKKEPVKKSGAVRRWRRLIFLALALGATGVVLSHRAHVVTYARAVKRVVENGQLGIQ